MIHITGPMERNISSWIVPILLAVGCIALVMNIFQAKKVNKSLVVDIEQAQADLQVASDNGQDCKKQLDAKIADISAKDQQVATLTGNVDTLTEEKTKIQEELSQLTVQMEKANATIAALQADKDKPATELEAGKPAEAPKEEDKKVTENPTEGA